MRCLSRVLVPACLALGLTSAGFARETSASIRLVAPQAGATLAAGSMAELEWTPAEPFADLSQIEEWEAFLSVDGGSTYPVRITPHLDQDLRRIRFQVPSVPTADARILLRFGDERRETAVELPERFAIEASPVQTFLLIHQAATAGEPALPGQTGVVAWVEGSRRGGSLRQMVAPETSGLFARLAPPAAQDGAAVLVSEPESPRPLDTMAADGTAAAPPAGNRSVLVRAGTGPALSSDILLLTQRQNE
jgi:hypothetical protein